MPEPREVAHVVLEFMQHLAYEGGVRADQVYPGMAERYAGLELDGVPLPARTRPTPPPPRPPRSYTAVDQNSPAVRELLLELD